MKIQGTTVFKKTGENLKQDLTLPYKEVTTSK